MFFDGRVNSAHWILGHVLFIRNSLIELLGGVPVWKEEDFKHFDRGQKPIQEQLNSPDLETLKEFFQKSENELVRLFSQDIVVRSEDRQNVVGLVFHESYHAGQLGIVRKLLGKEGAIS